MSHDVINLIFKAAAKHPDKIALSHGKTAYTYRQVTRDITSIAVNLREHGLKAGDRFFFSVSPDPDGILLALGMVAAGAAIVFADPGTAPDLFEARRKLVNPRYAAAESVLYFASTPFIAPLVRAKGITMPDYRAIAVEKHFYAGKKLPGTPKGAISVEKLKEARSYSTLPVTDSSKESIIVFTSGTTSHPKCVRHSRNSIGFGMSSFVEKCNIDETSYIHTDHFNFGVTAMIAGGQWDIPVSPPAKNAKKWVDNLIKRNVTHTFLVPADTTLMLNEIEKRNLDTDSIKLGSLAMGAAPVLPSLIKRVNRILPDTKVLAVYGMTEILPIAITDGKNKILHSGEGDLAGKIQPGVTAWIDSPDENGAGELALSGPGLMLGYLGEASRAEHRTGDMAKFNEAGELVLLGRIKDMLIRANKNIYPGLYEAGITDLPGIETCAIVGVPDVYGEDVVVLAIVPEDKTAGVEEFKKMLAPELTRLIDGDAQPDVVIVVDAIPLAGRSNKPDRITLRKMMSEEPEVAKILREHDHG